MIWTVCQISILRLWNNKQELVLAFVVPMIFFSIFALVFSRGVGQTVSQVRVAFVDDDQSRKSLAIIREACSHPEIKLVTGIGRTSTDWPIDKLSRTLISRRNVEVVVHIPHGFTTQNPDAPTLSIHLFNEGVNPIGHRLVQASLAESIAMQLSAISLAATKPVRPEVVFASTSAASTNAASNSKPSTTTQGLESSEPAVFKSVNAFASNKHQPKVAMVAAGIAVMFLLFSANGAGASLLEEREAGTLGRLLSSRLSLNELLIGKWLYITGLGCTQLFAMFAWGQIVFQVDMTGHLAGFAAMTFATSAACASFALFLASLCKSRQQLHGVSVVLVLTMSAIGGSMVPRYIMSDTMKQLGKFTFNGWALDGFQKVFWYDLPLSEIRLEVFILLSITLLLGLVASILARRWGAA
ncbi:MAG: ABC transporter permease [Pirellulaceae bacterium]|nr:ABC transporter permease [Pirellulaceae bacterium]